MDIVSQVGLDRDRNNDLGEQIGKDTDTDLNIDMEFSRL
tara:strand:+ start:745 stop:861 length:117 start_codon:yes stop_codon:yes gene_type:complete